MRRNAGEPKEYGNCVLYERGNAVLKGKLELAAQVTKALLPALPWWGDRSVEAGGRRASVGVGGWGVFWIDVLWAGGRARRLDGRLLWQAGRQEYQDAV